MKKLLILLTVFVPVLHAQPERLKPRVGSLTTFYEQVIPLVVIGEGWTERFVIQNTDSSLPSIVTISFFTQAGDPMSVNLKGYAPASSLTINIPLGTTVALETVPDSGYQRLGWAYVSASSSGLGDFFGQIIFRKKYPGLPDFMCSMPFGALGFHGVSTFFDNTNGNSTGMGVVTSDNCLLFGCTSIIVLSATVRDISGAIVSTKTFTQRQGTLYWMDLGTDFPETKGRAGTFEVKIVNSFATTLTGVSLQYATNGAFTFITPFEQ